MTNILNTFISKVVIDLDKNNDDVMYVSTPYFSPRGDVYTLDKRTISPNVLMTTQSLQELIPEVSKVYPFAIVSPIDIDGSTIIFSPSLNTFPTASQNYYNPVYIERYNQDVLYALNREFTELTNESVDAESI